ncbi:hypothetical protein I7I50_00712 [Histoplasma capsulatum G186AR]|uniref:Uncharacterized protein n=1 Tax=Ajellomyces capsulatus TaxID=5037 RepID=A0A8H8CV40_AJECA|nr:hypothetical protein I7I52_07980 [Histoplasma capsulatum]QSS72766.1 hypothetical protein I7I50_00712 [Histoplasma capsulatum G186AR]
MGGASHLDKHQILTPHFSSPLQGRDPTRSLRLDEKGGPSCYHQFSQHDLSPGLGCGWSMGGKADRLTDSFDIAEKKGRKKKKERKKERRKERKRPVAFVPLSSGLRG